MKKHLVRSIPFLLLIGLGFIFIPRLQQVGTVNVSASESDPDCDSDQTIQLIQKLAKEHSLLLDKIKADTSSAEYPKEDWYPTSLLDIQQRVSECYNHFQAFKEVRDLGMCEAGGPFENVNCKAAFPEGNDACDYYQATVKPSFDGLGNKILGIWQGLSNDANWSLSIIRLKSQDQTTKAVVCEAQLTATVSHWGSSSQDITYSIEKTSDGWYAQIYNTPSQ